MMIVEPGEVEERLTELAELLKLSRAFARLLESRIAIMEGWLHVLEFRLMEGNCENGIFVE